MGVLTCDRRLALGLLLGAVWSAMSAPAAALPAQRARLSDAEAKAGFLYNCALFVAWPETAFGHDVLTIGVFGDDAMFRVVEEMDGRMVNGRRIDVVAIDSLDDLAGTHILFVAGGDREVRAVLERVGTAPTLTVGEVDRFTSDGGGVRLYTDQGRLRFEINMTQVERAGLRVSAKMLGLATIVR